MFDDAEPPFGHPGRNFDDTSVNFDGFDDRYEPPAADPHDKGVVHYGPGYRPLCGAESRFAAHTDDPAQVSGCPECLELVEEDLADHNEYGGWCLHCRKPITATGGVAWRRTVRRPCPHCGKPGWCPIDPAFPELRNRKSPHHPPFSVFLSTPKRTPPQPQPHFPSPSNPNLFR